MPGAGKSTAGVILAKARGMHYIDTDIVLQERSGRLLQDLIDEEGAEAFLEAEEAAILSLRCTNTVIATGGSVVLNRKAMEHLKRQGTVVYLQISFEEMVSRLSNITTRGIVLLAGQNLPGMYNQRAPLYERYADITIDCTNAPFEEVVELILERLGSPV
jgi:shikimate kinase